MVSTSKQMMHNLLSTESDMKSALLIYRDKDGDIAYQSSTDLGLGDAILMLEKVKLTLLERA